MLVQKSARNYHVCFWWVHGSTEHPVHPSQAEPLSKTDGGLAPPIVSYQTPNMQLSKAASISFSRASSTFIRDV